MLAFPGATRNALHLIAQARKGRLRAQDRELQIQNQQVETLRFFVFRLQFRRQSRHFVRQLGVRNSSELTPCRRS